MRSPFIPVYMICMYKTKQTKHTYMYIYTRGCSPSLHICMYVYTYIYTHIYRYIRSPFIPVYMNMYKYI